MPVAGSALARGAITGTGAAIAGLPEMTGDYNQKLLKTLDRIDKGEKVSMADDPIGYQDMDPEMRKQARADVERVAASYNPQDTTLYKAGTAVENFAKEKFPLSPEEEKSVTAQAAGTVGGMLPFVATGMVASPAVGVGLGMTQMGLSGAHEQAEAARAKGATPEQTAEAARQGFYLGAGAGALPLHAALRPVERLAPGIADWARARLQHAVQSGVTFATLGEAQTYLGQQIAQNYYDPEAGYSPDIKRVLGSLLGGAFLGGMTSTPFRAGESPAAVPAVPANQHVDALQNILGDQPPPPPGAPPAAEPLPVSDQSILGGERTATGPVAADAINMQATLGVPEQPNAPLDFTPGLKAQGQDQADALKARWAAESPIKTVDDLFAGAHENQAMLGNLGESIADDLGVGFKNPGVKGRPRTQEKIDGGKSPARINDVVRAGFVVDHPSQADAVVWRIGQQYPIIDEGWAVTPTGYFDRKIIVRFPNGQAGEVQLWHPDLLEAKDQVGHKLYLQSRTLKDGDPQKAELESKQREIYGQALVNADPEWKAVLGRSGNPGNLASKSAFDNTRPSIPTSDELAFRQDPLANTQASPGAQTKGSPSTVPNVNAMGTSADNIVPQAPLGNPVSSIPPHRVTSANGMSVDVSPVVVEADRLRTSQDQGYDPSLQPRQRDRAASQAQVRDIATNLDPARLGYSAEADRGAPIVGPDGMVESGNGRVLALRSVYDQGGEAALAYRSWLARQGVDVSAYRNPVLVRQRTTPLTRDQRQAFTVGANQAATLSMSAPERALADARLLDADAISLIHNPDDLGSAGNRAFVRRFVAQLPQGEQGMMADAKGALSADGLARVRNAVLAKAYGDAGLLSRIAESTNDEVRSISSALTAAAPQWARLRAEIEAGRVRPDMDATSHLLDAVSRTADIRGRGDKLDTYLAQQDAFDRMPTAVEGFMRMFYDPKGQRAASAKRISDEVKFYAQEAAKVSSDEGLGLGLVPVRPEDILRLTTERQRDGYGAEEGISDRNGTGNGALSEADRGEVRGSWLGAGRERSPEEGNAGDQESAIRAQRLSIDEQRRLASEPIPLAGGKTGEQFVFPGAERISAAELAKRRAAEPLRPKTTQRPVDEGLFGGQQLDLVDQARQAAAKAAIDNGSKEPQIAGTEAPNAARQGTESTGIRAGTPAVSQGAQAGRARRATPVGRPEQLSLFGGGDGERSVFDANDAAQKQPGSVEAAVPGPSDVVTKPPQGSGRDRAPRSNTPAIKGLTEAQTKIAGRSRSNYRITDADQIGVGGPKQKINDNINAIRILKLIEDEGRDATPGEKAILVKYVGWGAFAQDMFAPNRKEWKQERDAFRSLVTDEEFNAAKGSTLNAHYTSPDVVRGMWDAINYLGYKGGMALEPAAGIGHFIGLIPDSVAPKTAWTAVELDSLTGRIAKALYGNAEVNVHGFEDLKRPANHYDLAISNVPFGNYNLSEKPYGAFPIHDFFFVKSLDKVRPGGVVAFVTSRYSMDRVDPSTRRLLSKSADLVGAIRLPGGNKGAFAGNAGTAVTTDIMFLRKKIPGETPFPAKPWMDLKEIQTPDGPAKINEYFADNPQMMLGEMRLQGTMYRDNEPVLVGDGGPLQDKILAAAQNMPKGSFVQRIAPATVAAPTIHGNDIATGIKDGAFFIGENGKLYQRREGAGFEHPLNADDTDRVTRLVGMRDTINDLLTTQLSGGDNAPAQSEQARAKLRDAYDAFVAKHGPINKEDKTVTSRLNKAGEPVVITKYPNIAKFMADPDAWKVAAIENYDPDTGKAKRADIQTKDVINAPKEREINGPSDAVAASLDQTGGIDLDHIAQSLNLNTQEEVVHALGDMVYQNPDGRKWETSDNYLSGNVVKKLEDAKAIAQEDPSYLRNVSALEKVQPEPLTGTDITAQFGAPWVPADVYESFLKEIGGSGVNVTQVPVTGEWKAKATLYSRDARSKYGTDRVAVEKVVDAALNNKQLTVWDEDSDGNKHVNDKATTEARIKVDALKEAFTGDADHGIDGWAFADPERAQLLEGIYNRTYNNLVQRKFDGTHLTLPGLNPDFSTRQHRKDSIWRMIQNGNTLLAHVVGSGKAQPLDAKVLTPAGWRRMGDILPGAVVIAGDGSHAKVTGVFPQGEKDIFRVVFSDGGSTECCDEHLWLTETYRERSYKQRGLKLGKKWACGTAKVRPLSDIRTTLVADHLDAKNHSIPIVQEVQFRSAPVPVDPYLLGVLIGDGCLTMRRVLFSTSDNFILSAVSNAIPEDCELVHIGKYDYAIAFRGKVARAVGERGSVPSHPVKNALISLGLMGRYSYEKRVPSSYLYNDINTRVAVLRGLMDTDGTVDKRGVGVSFTTTSPGLADDVSELVRSLGGIVGHSVRTPSGGREATTLFIAMPPHINPFLLPRKADRVRPKTKYAPARYIVSVEPVGRKAAQCISIDHPSHLYVTDDYIVTHNTVTMIAGGMEQKRLGLISKPAYVIPNHMLEQFSREFIQAYPDAKILVAQKDETTRENRKAFLAKVASNDWDGVIITHDAFGRINMGQDFRKKFIQDQLDELSRVMSAEAKTEGKNSPTVKSLEKSKKRLEGRLANLMAEERKDDGTSFEESGIDYLYVDEAHKFKNLSFITRLQRIKGLAQGDSQRAEDLFLKIRYLEQNRPGRSATFATGTPVSNTMAELWTMQRYLQLDKLKERGLDSFDAWASTFGRVVNNMELSADGRTFKEVSSFSKFVNVPELVALYSEIADTKTAEMLNLPRPEVKTSSGAPGIEIVQAEPSSQEEDHINKLVALAESLKGKRPEKGQPNMLSVVTEGRKVATDGRLISSDFDFNPQGKIAKAVDNISRIYKEGNVDPSAPNKVQMVFLDMGVPQSKTAAKARKVVDVDEDIGADPAQAAAPRMDLYADIKKRLVDAGIPANEIAAIHDATDDAKKAKLFQKVRQGQVRVILGSSEKMGVGTNVQDRLIAMHHLDAPWKPSDVEQRDGRIVRQGNKNPAVQIYRYVTKKSFDAFMWQKLDTKSKFIGQVLSGAKGSRSAEDIDNPLPEAAEMKAAASGDPRIIEHAELDRQVRALTAQRRSFEATKSRATWEAGTAKARIEHYEKVLPDAKADAAMAADVSGDKFVVELGGTQFTDRKTAGETILAQLLSVDPRTFYSPKVVNIGKLSGFDMNVELRGRWDGDGAVLSATPSLKGKTGYAAINDTIINAQTDPSGLIRRYENILSSVRQKPAQLERELDNEKNSVKSLEKTLAQTWPKEKDYRDAITKLDDLTKSLKAPKHPDVAEAQEAEVRAQRPVPTFYSAVDRTIQNARQEKATPDQWLGMLRNAPGVKPEEMQWLGLDDWLTDQKGQVTKQQIADYVRANQIEVREVEKGAGIPRVGKLTDKDVMAFQDISPEIWEKASASERSQMRAEAEKFSGPSGTKFEGYVTPGGENYRELLLTLPQKADRRTPLETARDMFGQDVQTIYTLDREQTRQLQAAIDKQVEQGKSQFRGSHWDEPNVLAHVRFNDRTIDGKKTLFLEEVQSDWHQQGRRKGYNKPIEKPITIEQIPGTDRYHVRGEAANSNEIITLSGPEGLPLDRATRLRDDITAAAGRNGVPDAPFKTTWPELAMKRMIRYAAENGYEQVAWTPGDVQAARYDLSQHVKEIEYVKNSDGTYKLGIADKEGEPIRSLPGINVNRMTLEQIGETVGKEIADKITKGEGKKYQGHEGNTLDGLDLKVGGEGMKAFYDDILPSTVNKLVKKYGTKVRQELLNTGVVSDERFGVRDATDQGEGEIVGYHPTHEAAMQEAEELGGSEVVDLGNGQQPIHSLDLTPALRDAATSQGFPLFRRGWDAAEGRDFGPKPGETAIAIGRKTEAHIKPTDKYTAAEQKIADAVKEIGDRMAPQATVAGTSALRQNGSPIWGAFINSKAFPHLIAWSLEQSDAAKIAGTVRHEIIHHLRNSGLIRPDEWAALRDAAIKDGWLSKYNIHDRYPDLSLDHKIEEAVAERFSQWRPERSIEKPGLIRDAFQRMDLMFRRVAAAARRFLGKDATASDVFTRIETGEIGRRKSDQIEAQKAYQGREAAQTPGEEARKRREGTDPQTIGQNITHYADIIRAKSAEFAKSIGLDHIVQEMQMKVAPMAARNATVESRAIAKEFMNARRQARQSWNEADKYIMNNFSHEDRRAMWDAADEESVAIQQGRPTTGIGLDRLPPEQRAVVEMLQARGRKNFQEAKDLKMVEGEGLPSYAPRMLVRMSETGKPKRGAGAGSEVVRDVRTLAVANANLENAIATRRLIDTIAEAGKRSGNPTVNDGGAPVRSAGPLNTISHVLDEFGRGTTATTPQLLRRKYLTREETEAAANRVPTPDENAPSWFTLSNPAFQRLEPRMVDADPKVYRDAVKRVSGMTVDNVKVPARDEDGNIIYDKKPIYIREEFEGPLRSILSRDNNVFYRGLMALKGKVMSVVMFSPLIHNQVEWGRALPAAPGKVVTFQTYFEGNKVANDPAQMREAISGGVVPIGGHGYMQDIESIAEAPTVRPGRSLMAKGLGYGAEGVGHLTQLYDPRSTADQVRGAVDWFGNLWHNTLLWDRIKDLQMGLWSHLRQHLIDKGYDPYAANVAAAHFANRYAGALPLEAMSGLARGVANTLLFSRSFTLGNIGAYKDALLGLPRDAQALIQQKLGWDELQKVQSYVKRKSRAMLAIDAGLYYATLSALQSSFHVAGVGHTVATLGGMIAGGALGGKAGPYGRLAAAAGLGAAGFGLASVLGASQGTRDLEDELGRYWTRFKGLLGRIEENPLQTLGNPFKMIDSLGATAENEPGKQNRLLLGYDKDGTAIYARLAAGKVTEELMGYMTEPNEMIHRKLSTFARPLVELYNNDSGFGRKVYNPKADTPAEVAKNIMKISALLVGEQLPISSIKGAYDWARGGKGSDTAGLKAVAPLFGTTVSSGYPGGPELGILADVKERQKYRQQEALPGIRDQIRQGDISGALAKMEELNIAPALQRYYIATTQNPEARLSKRQMQDFMRSATPEEQRQLQETQINHTNDRAPQQAAGGAVVARADGGSVDASYDTPLSADEETDFQKWKAVNAPNDSGADYDLRGAFKAGLHPAENGHWDDTFKKPNHPTFSTFFQYAKDRPDLAGTWDGDQYVPPVTAHYARGGRVDPKNINHSPTEAQKHANNYAHDKIHILGLPISIENAKGSYRGGIGADGKPWKVRMVHHYGYIRGTEARDGDHVDCHIGPHRKSPHVFVIDQIDHKTGKYDEPKVMLCFANERQAIRGYEDGFSDGKGKDRIGKVTAMTVKQFRDWLEHGNTKAPFSHAKREVA